MSKKSKKDSNRTPYRKAPIDVGLERITWSKNEVNVRDLLSSNKFPTLVCMARSLHDDVMTLEAGKVLQLHGHIRGSLDELLTCRVEEVAGVMTSVETRTREGARSSKAKSCGRLSFKSREISTINEDEEEEEEEVFDDDPCSPGGLSIHPANDVIIASTIERGWMQSDQVILLPSSLRPTFRMSSRPSKMPEREWLDLLDTFMRSARQVDLTKQIVNWAEVTPVTRRSHGVRDPPGTTRNSVDVPDQLDRPRSASSASTSNLREPWRVVQFNECADLMRDSNENLTRPRAKTEAGHSMGNSHTKISDVRRIKSLLSVYEDVPVEGSLGRDSNSQSNDKRSSFYASCSELNRSILSLFSASNLSLSPSLRESEILNILRPKNYRRPPAEPSKPKSRFSIFRAKKSKKHKSDDSEQTRNSVQAELEKTKMYVDLLDLVGRQKSSDPSLASSILNLSDLSNLGDGRKSSFADLTSMKHLSMPCGIDKIREAKSIYYPELVPSLSVERYVINKAETEHHGSPPSDSSIARRKQIKTNTRMQNKLGSQTNCSANDSSVSNEETVKIPLCMSGCGVISKSVENVRFSSDIPCNLQLRERPCLRLGNSMIGPITRPEPRRILSKSVIQDTSQPCRTIENISQSVAHLPIDHDPLPPHLFPVIRTNPNLPNRRGKHLKNKNKQFSKWSLSTEDDFQFVRLLSVRKTSDNNSINRWRNSINVDGDDAIDANTITNNIIITNNNSIIINNNDRVNRSKTGEAIYENIGFLSADQSPRDSLPFVVESLDSRTNSTESSDYIASDSSFGRNNEPASSPAKIDNIFPTNKCPQPKPRLKFYEDDGYQSKSESFDNFNNSIEFQFNDEIVSYL